MVGCRPYKKRQGVLAFSLLLSFLFLLLPKISISASATARESTTVTTAEELADAIFAQKSEVNLGASIDLIPGGGPTQMGGQWAVVLSPLTITGSSQNTLTIKSQIVVGQTLTLDGCTVICEGEGSFNCQKEISIIIQGGKVDGLTTSESSPYHTISFQPHQDITATNCQSPFEIIPQPGYDLDVTIDGVPVPIGSSGYQSPNGAQNISIKVQEAFDPSAGNDKVTVDGNEITYAWSYGGSITEEDGTFTITPYQATGVNYVIDTVVVDGEAQNVTDRNNPMEIRGAQSSVFATFAYTLDF